MIDGIRHNIPFLPALMQHRAGRRESCRPASSPRNFPTAFTGARRTGRRRRVSPRSRPRSITCSASASAASPASAPARPVTRERRRVVRLGDSEIVLDVTREGDGDRGPLRRRDGKQAARARVALEARRAAVVGHGRRPSDLRAGAAGAQRLRALPIAASRRAPTSITEREAAAARLMPAKKPPTAARRCAVRCRGWWSRSRWPRGRRSRPARRCGGRGDEDGERAARRTRRRGQAIHAQAGRQPRGRCGDHGVRVTNLP